MRSIRVMSAPLDNWMCGQTLTQIQRRRALSPAIHFPGFFLFRRYQLPRWENRCLAKCCPIHHCRYRRHQAPTLWRRHRPYAYRYSCAEMTSTRLDAQIERSILGHAEVESHGQECPGVGSEQALMLRRFHGPPWLNRKL